MGGPLEQQKVCLRGFHAPTIRAWLDRPVTALVLHSVAESQHTKRFTALKTNAVLCENLHCAFLNPHIGGLEAKYSVHIRLIEKCIVDFLLVIIDILLVSFTATSNK